LKHPPSDKTCQSALSDIEQIQIAAERATRLTRQLLAFARREVVQPRVLNLNVVVASVCRMLQRTLGEHIELITVLDPNLDFVLADPGHIEQILVNLAVNARDVLPGGGELIIETRNFDVDAAFAATCANLSEGRYAMLSVRDNGPGMPPEVIDRAFEPFYTTKPKGEGTGLGLATVYGIVTQARGNVRITSEPGHGTTVTVLLPVTDQASAAEPDSRREPERGRGERVLVVEDAAAMREVTRRILVHNGYQVIAVASGQEAIHAADSCHERIAALLTDVRMPGMQGKEISERVRELQPGIAVLFMSGYTRDLLSAQGILEPGISLIEKPFTKTSLLEEVSELLHARTA
jgi:CheY-like chemotaxis protein